MSKPQVFVSSTYYDLKHIRSSLAQFIESLGYESILSERGNIPYVPDQPLDQSCYRVAGRADIFVLIIGDRYGSEASSEEDTPPPKKHLDHYDSVTKKEFEAAVRNGVPVFILVDSSVHTEYRTYLQNKGNEDIKYAHVDDVNIFVFIEDILAKKRNNPVYSFDRFTDIENWLKEQWAGLFQELLGRMSDEQQLSSLSSQFEELKEINNTLKAYIEALMEGKDETEKKALIESEGIRLVELERIERIRANDFVIYLIDRFELSFNEIYQAIIKASSFNNFLNMLQPVASDDKVTWESSTQGMLLSSHARADINLARKILDLPEFS